MIKLFCLAYMADINTVLALNYHPMLPAMTLGKIVYDPEIQAC